MTQSELIKKISVETGKTENDIDMIIKTYHEKITESLKKGDDVKLHGFGRFSARKYGERKCYNPQNGELMMLKPSVQPAFTAGPKLRRELNN